MAHSGRVRQRNYVRRLRQAALQSVAFPGAVECSVCGRTRELELAHVRPTGLSGPSRGSVQRARDALRSPACYAIMCHECHVIYDAKRRNNGRV